MEKKKITKKQTAKRTGWRRLSNLSDIITKDHVHHALMAGYSCESAKRDFSSKEGKRKRKRSAAQYELCCIQSVQVKSTVSGACETLKSWQDHACALVYYATRGGLALVDHSHGGENGHVIRFSDLNEQTQLLSWRYFTRNHQAQDVFDSRYVFGI